MIITVEVENLIYAKNKVILCVLIFLILLKSPSISSLYQINFLDNFYVLREECMSV